MKPVVLPGLRSLIEECCCICGERVFDSVCCSSQPGFEFWAVSLYYLGRGGDLASGNMGALAEQKVLTKVNKQLSVSLKPGVSTFLFLPPRKALWRTAEQGN